MFRFKSKLVCIALFAISGLTCARYEAEGSYLGFALLNQNSDSFTGSIAGGAFSLGGSITGFATGSNLILQEAISGQSVNLNSGVSSFTFGMGLNDGASYNVQITGQPTSPDNACSLSNAAGTISGSSVSNVNINCVVGKVVGGTVLSPPTFAGTPQLTTLAGDLPPGATSGFADGLAGVARFNNPRSIATDGTNLYVIDVNNDKIRKIVIATGEVSTFAAAFSNPVGISSDGIHIYVSDTSDHTIYKIEIATGIKSVLAGGNSGGGVTCSGTLATNCKDGIGSAAQFKAPQGITTDGTNLYVADTGNNRIRMVVLGTGAVSTIAGNGNTTFYDAPQGIVTTGTLAIIADTGNSRILTIPVPAGGTSTTIVGGTGVQGLTTDGSNVYWTSLADVVVRYDSLTTGGSMTFMAGAFFTENFIDGDASAMGRMTNPIGLTCDGDAIYIADAGNHAIRKLK